LLTKRQKRFFARNRAKQVKKEHGFADEKDNSFPSPEAGSQKKMKFNALADNEVNTSTLNESITSTSTNDPEMFAYSFDKETQDPACSGPPSQRPRIPRITQKRKLPDTQSGFNKQSQSASRRARRGSKK
jgi:hypothetical protein